MDVKLQQIVKAVSGRGSGSNLFGGAGVMDESTLKSI
jgi:hypothetical protein